MGCFFFCFFASFFSSNTNGLLQILGRLASFTPSTIPGIVRSGVWRFVSYLARPPLNYQQATNQPKDQPINRSTDLWSGFHVWVLQKLLRRQAPPPPGRNPRPRAPRGAERSMASPRPSRTGTLLRLLLVVVVVVVVVVLLLLRLVLCCCYVDPRLAFAWY